MRRGTGGREGKVQLTRGRRGLTIAVGNGQRDLIARRAKVVTARRRIAADLRSVAAPYVVGDRRAALRAGAIEGHSDVAVNGYRQGQRLPITRCLALRRHCEVRSGTSGSEGQVQ